MVNILKEGYGHKSDHACKHSRFYVACKDLLHAHVYTYILLLVIPNEAMGLGQGTYRGLK